MLVWYKLPGLHTAPIASAALHGLSSAGLWFIKYVFSFLAICDSLPFTFWKWLCIFARRQGSVASYKIQIVLCALAADDTCKLTCENGGKCIINEKGDPRCHCWPSYSGERCETNHCYNYCQNGGTCGASLLGTYFCAALYYLIGLNLNVWIYS